MSFDYIGELDAFSAWLATHSMPSSCFALYHVLLEIAYHSGGKTTFSADAALLRQKTGGLSYQTIRNARERLQDEGWISYQSVKGGRETTYTLLLDYDKNHRSQDGNYDKKYRSQENDYDKNSSSSNNYVKNYRSSKTNYDNFSSSCGNDYDKKYRSSSDYDKNQRSQDSNYDKKYRSHERESAQREREIDKYIYINNQSSSFSSSSNLEKTKSEEQPESISLFERRIHPFSRLIEREMLEDLISDYGDDETAKAIEIAANAGGRSVKYISAILANRRRKEAAGHVRTDDTGVSESELSHDIQEAAARGFREALEKIRSKEKGNHGGSEEVPGKAGTG